MEEALANEGEGDGDVERWITVEGRHIPICKGQSVEEAIQARTYFEKHATRGEKNRRSNEGQKWHNEQATAAKASRSATENV